VADSLGSAVLTLSVDDRQYNAGLQRARQKADSSLGGVKGADLGGAGLTALTGGLTAAAVGAAAVGAAVIGVGAAAVQSAGNVQKLQAAFTGLTGSAEAASRLRQQLFDLSKTTPFKNEEILQASQRFLAVGVSVESLNGTINRVGALAAQAGQPLERLALIYAQVYAKGRLQGEENLQLLEAGVDLSQELAQVTGLTGSALQDAMSKGQIGINAFNEALVLATGDMAALQQAGKAVDVQFNNIGDNLGQLFGGFAQAISPALSAAFKVINDIFESAFPDLNSIVDFFAPLTKEAQRFADVLGSSPGIIEVVAAELKSLGGVIIQNIADGISFVSDLLANVDQKKFIQGFIDAELFVRRLFLAASALGAQLVKNAELSARAVSNPLQFGRDIAESGGFGQFIEKEYKTVERKWNDWANSEPLKFPDLTGKGSDQVDKITGNLSTKITPVINKSATDAQRELGLEQLKLQAVNQQVEAATKLAQVEQGIVRSTLEQVLNIQAGVAAAKRREQEIGLQIDFARQSGDENKAAELVQQQRTAAAETKLAIIEGATALRDAGAQLRKDAQDAFLNLQKLRTGSDGLNQFLGGQDRARREENVFQSLLPSFRQAQRTFTQLTGAAAPEFSGATSGVNQSILQFIDAVRAEQQALNTSVNTQRALNDNTAALAQVTGELRTTIAKLTTKNWAVQVNVAADGSSQAYGDILAGAVSP
jgi:tape measure domain-containing protein